MLVLTMAVQIEKQENSVCVYIDVFISFVLLVTSEVAITSNGAVKRI